MQILKNCILPPLEEENVAFQRLASLLAVLYALCE
jgi:hypothetical protein